MIKIVKYGWWITGAGWAPEEPAEETKTETEGPDMKTVMVYLMDEKNMKKEPIGILVERRKEERENNVVGMLRLARKEFASTEEESSKIFIGDYI